MPPINLEDKSRSQNPSVGPRPSEEASGEKGRRGDMAENTVEDARRSITPPQPAEARRGFGIGSKLPVALEPGGGLTGELTVPELARLAIITGEETPRAFRIVFNRSSIVGREFEYMMQALRGGHISGNGAFTRRAQALLEKRTGAHRALLTTSCTHALEMAALLLDLKPSDEVILPSFTFVSTVNAFALRGAR